MEKKEIVGCLKDFFRRRQAKLSPSLYRAIGKVAQRFEGMTYAELDCWLNGFAQQSVEALKAEVLSLARQEVLASL